MVSNVKLQNLDLIDLLSDRHNLMRNKLEKTWNDHSNIYISNSEWYIIAHIYKKQPTISNLTKNAEISRQAIHKHVKNLAEKGLVEIKNVEYNKKEKYIQLTILGEKCYEKYIVLKTRLENTVAKKIGTEQVNVLKNLLEVDWGIE
ncbi:MAG TPA: MarR family winged helix-turn-helix transcriptional regulator [Pseudogracilibacillus sp.]|nr:MarR family winged helix-turn-helix transcriptional regulator [Pseudogracilibacillus sp.]